MSQKTDFTAKRCFLSAEQHLNFTPEKVFPLLCPTCEYDWIESWDCKLIYSKSGFAELDCIFTTNFEGDEKDVWVVDQHEPNKMIQFIRVSENRVIRYRISLTDIGDGQTTAIWEQTVTALTPAGNRYVESLTDLDFGLKMKRLEIMINFYLETGEMLKTEK
jgi:hypothetical protein